MAMLEQLGYLEQPHTSAGRVPTFSGYRLYIDKIMKTQTLPDDEVKRLDKMLEDQGAVTEELVIQSAATALAELTQCAVVASNAAPKFSVISKVEVIPTGKRLYVILLITSNGSIKTRRAGSNLTSQTNSLNFYKLYRRKSSGNIHI